MQERDHAKAASLIVGGVVTIAAVAGRCGMPDMGIGIYPDCPIYARILHPLVHTGLIHAAVNVYVWLKVVFFCDIHPRQLLRAWLVACSCPVTLATIGGSTTDQVVGLSGVIYALLGMLMPQVRDRRAFNIWIAAYLFIGWLVGGVAVGFHLYCYMMGCLSLLIITSHK